MTEMGNSMGSWEAHIAIKQKNVSLIQQYLQAGKLNPNLKFRRDSLLTTAINENQLEILKLLLENGADPNLKSYENGRSEPPLITATRLNNLKAVELLVSHGANIQSSNFYGHDAIFRAVYENSFKILEFLLLNAKATITATATTPLSSPSSSSSTSSKVPVQLPSSSSLSLVETTKANNSIPENNTIPLLSPTTHSHTLKNKCPLILAIKDAPVYPLKKRCLYLLLKYNYTCPCLKPECSIFSEIYECEFYYKIYETDPDILRWVYLAKGFRIYFMYRKYHATTAVTSNNDQQQQQQQPQPQKEEEASSVEILNNNPASIIFPLKLTNLVRICLRNEISKISIITSTNFTVNLLKLPLPKKLLDFLLLEDLIVS